MKKQELQSNEYDKYYSNYLNLVSSETELIPGLKEDQKMVIDYFSSIPEDKLEFRYQTKKWTIKEVLQHIIDTERIFMYRLLRISRKDTTPLAGFDQDVYVDPSEANNKSIEDLIEEFSATRLFTINLVNSMSDENLKNLGSASNSPVSARACAFILLGHSIWHINIIKERYLC